MHMKTILSLILISTAISINAFAETNDVFASSNVENAVNPSDETTIKEGKGAGGLNASLVVQMEELKEQLKKIRGDLEQVQFENARINEKFVKFTADIELRLSDLNRKSAVPNKDSDQLDDFAKNLGDDLLTVDPIAVNHKGNKDSAANTATNKDGKQLNVGPHQVAKDATIDVKSDKEGKKKAIQQQYQDAYNLLQAKDYKAARDSFLRFVKNNPDDELAGSAYYWLGETFFLRIEFDKAAVNYLKGYQTNVHGTRAPDNLLKLSKSLAKIDKRKEACTTLLKLKKEFPTASTSIKKQMQEGIKILRCNP